MQRKATFDADGVQVSSEIDDRGNELPDPLPMAPPVGYQPEPTLGEMIRRFVQSEQLRAKADAEGFDNWEEANDFDIPDDPLDPDSPWEDEFDPGHAEPSGVSREGRAAEAGVNAGAAAGGSDPSTGGGGGEVNEPVVNRAAEDPGRARASAGAGVGTGDREGS